MDVREGALLLRRQLCCALKLWQLRPPTMAARSVILGIDLGTTSVKAALVESAPGDPSGFLVLASCARAARAEAAAQSAAAGPQVRQRPGVAPPRGAILLLLKRGLPPTPFLQGSLPDFSSLPDLCLSAAAPSDPLGFFPVAFPPAGADLLPHSGLWCPCLMALYPLALSPPLDLREISLLVSVE